MYPHLAHQYRCHSWLHDGFCNVVAASSLGFDPYTCKCVGEDVAVFNGAFSLLIDVDAAIRTMMDFATAQQGVPSS